LGQRREPSALAPDCIRPKIEGFCDGVAMARSLLVTLFVNATLDFMAEVVEKVCSYVVPSLSFGLYAGAEALFLYGLYMVFFGSPHAPP
jgi:hypothetical protein